MITTLIANYNYGRYIEDAIKSALNQTQQNYILVVDDCSSDNSVAVAYQVLQPTEQLDVDLPDQTIRIARNNRSMIISLTKNVGPSRARNIGIQATINQTKYYQILDADDMMYPNKIETLLQYVDNNVAGVYADYMIQRADGLSIPEYKEPFSLERLEKSCIIHSGSLINAEALKKCGLYREDMRVAEDYNLWVRFAKAGYTFVHVPEFLSLVRDHQQNSSNSVNKSVWQECWSKVWQ